MILFFVSNGKYSTLIFPQLKDITFVYMVVYEEAQIYDLTVCLYVSQTLTPDTRAQQLFILLF